MGLRAPLSGLSIGNPLYEWIQAAHYDNMSYAEFSEQPLEYQEMIIAAYRVKNQSEAIIAKSMKPKKKKGK